VINLLPPERAIRIRYGRGNSLLIQWLISMGIAIVGLVLIVASGVVYINQQSGDLKKNIATDNEQLTTGDIGQVEANVKAISSDVKLINQVLSREIRFSDLMQQIGKVMPAGTVLSSLTLTNINGAMDITANTLDNPSAAQIAINLSDPGNNLFTHVDIVSIACANDHPTSPYPCVATYRALFSKSASSRFLNVAKGPDQ